MNAIPAAPERETRPGLEAILAAAARLRERVHHTPVLRSASIDRELGTRVMFKCENFQRVGAFKARGATNAVWSLDDAAAKRGVATHSSGNHGAALALAATERGIPCWVVVPENAASVKRDAIGRYGAQIVDCAPTMAARESGLAAVVHETGAAVIHPFDDDRVIAGQGTAALEMLDAEPAIDLLLCPVGGGGLISGCAIVAASRASPVRVVGCEPAGADDARQSFLLGERITLDAPKTMADGLRASLGRRNFAIIHELVDDIVTVEEAEIVAAMRLIWERMKILIEPSAAVPVAALMNGAIDTTGRTVGVILSGGNIDLNRLPW